MLISERKLRKLIRSMIIESKRKKINENIIDDGSLEIDEFNEDYDDEDYYDDDDSLGFDVDNLSEEGGDDGDDGLGDSEQVPDEYDEDDEDDSLDDLGSNELYPNFYDPKNPWKTLPVHKVIKK